MKQLTLNDSSGLNITFIGEVAQDAGGNAKKIFQLVLQKISQEGNLFTGLAHSCLLVHNVLALQLQDLKVIGHIIAYSLLYGGGAPHFFSESVVTYLLNEPIGTRVVEEILDDTVRSALTKV